MLDSVAIWPVGLRVLDVNGKPVTDARLKFFDAGTSTPRVVYADAALSVPLGAVIYTDAGGYPVTGSGSTTKTSIYTGTGAYKLRITTSADVDIVAPIDNISGALDTTALLAGAGTFARTVISKSDAAYTIDATQSGAVYQSNPTSGTQTATLPSAITAGNSFACTIRHNGTLNAVKIASVSNQPIYLPGGTTTAGFVLTAYGHSVDLVCDGAGWTVVQETPPLIGGTKGFVDIVSRLTSPPSTPNPGARYILTGTPTGDWLGRTAGDIAESTGQGGWTFYTPPTNCGWCAYIRGETILTQFRSSAWVDLNNITAPNTSTLRRMIVSHTAASGTSGGATSALAYVARTLNTVDENSITIANGASADASLASNQITLPAGKYLVVYAANVFNVNAGLSSFHSTTTATEIISNNGFSANATADTNIHIGMGVLSLAATETFELRTKTNDTHASGLGRANALAGVTERHATVTIIDLSSLQGPQGTVGPQGNAGPGYLATSTTSLTIGIGPKTLTTQTGLAYAAGATVKIVSSADATKWMVGVCTSYSGSTLVVNVTNTNGSGTLASWNITLGGEQGAAGSAGGTGASGPVFIDYTFDPSSTTAADPGAGKVRASVATFAGSFNLYMSETDRLGNGLATFLQSWDDSTNPTTKGVLVLVDTTTPSNRTYLNIAGAITDNGTFDTIPVTYKSGATSLGSVNLSIGFAPAGDKGADGAGTFSSLTPGAGATSNTAAAAPGSAITTTGTISAAQLVNAQTGTTYTVVDGDRAKLLTLSNASAVAVTLPQANATDTFVSGWFVDVANIGAGSVTITPTTSTINGAASLVIPQGRGCRITSDGANYQISNKPLVAGADYAAPSVATAFTAQQNATPSALTSGTAWDVAAKQNATANVNGSTFTVANPSNAVAGGFYTLFVTYATSNTLGWGTAYKGVASISPSATAGKFDNFVFRYDGTNMHCVGYRLDTGA